MMDVVVEDADLTKDVIRLLGQELKTVRRQLQEAQQSLSARPDTAVPASNNVVELVQAENATLKERISALEHELATSEDLKSVKLEPSSTIKLEDLQHEESESMSATHVKLEKTLHKYERLKRAHQELTDTLAATETKLKEATTTNKRVLRDLGALQKQPAKMTPRCDKSIHTDPQSQPTLTDLHPFITAEAVTLREPDGQQSPGYNASTAFIEAQERTAAAEAQVVALKDDVKTLQLENALLRQQKSQSDSRKRGSDVRALLMEEADQEKCIATIMNLQEELAAEIEELERQKALKARQVATPDVASDENAAEYSESASGIAHADNRMDVDVIQICHQRDSEGNYYNRQAVIRSLPKPFSAFKPNSLVFPSSMDEAAIHSFLEDYCQKKNLNGAVLSGVQSFKKSGHGFTMVPTNGAHNPPKDGDINAKIRLSCELAQDRNLEVFVWRPNTRKTCYLGKIACFKMPPLTIEEIEDLESAEWNGLLKMMQGSFELPQIEAARDDRAGGCQAGKEDIAALHEDSTNKRKHEENTGNQTTGNQTKKAKLKRRH